MKYCGKCGKELVDAARFCSACGSAVISPRDRDGFSFGIGTLSFFLPAAGLVIFVIQKKAMPRRAKSAGLGALFGVITAALLYLAFCVLSFVLSFFFYV